MVAGRAVIQRGCVWMVMDAGSVYFDMQARNFAKVYPFYTQACSVFNECTILQNHSCNTMGQARGEWSCSAKSFAQCLKGRLWSVVGSRRTEELLRGKQSQQIVFSFTQIQNSSPSALKWSFSFASLFSLHSAHSIPQQAFLGRKNVYCTEHVSTWSRDVTNAQHIDANINRNTPPGRISHPGLSARRTRPSCNEQTGWRRVGPRRGQPRNTTNQVCRSPLNPNGAIDTMLQGKKRSSIARDATPNASSIRLWKKNALSFQRTCGGQSQRLTGPPWRLLTMSTCLPCVGGMVLFN